MQCPLELALRREPPPGRASVRGADVTGMPSTSTAISSGGSDGPMGDDGRDAATASSVASPLAGQACAATPPRAAPRSGGSVRHPAPRRGRPPSTAPLFPQVGAQPRTHPGEGEAGRPVAGALRSRLDPSRARAAAGAPPPRAAAPRAPLSADRRVRSLRHLVEGQVLRLYDGKYGPRPTRTETVGAVRAFGARFEPKPSRAKQKRPQPAVAASGFDPFK